MGIIHKRMVLFIFIFAGLIVISSGTAAASTNNTTTQTVLNASADAPPAGDNISTDDSNFTMNSGLETNIIPDPTNQRTGKHYTTIQGAIDDAQPGDTIQIESGTYKEHKITVDINLNLIGADKTNTIVDAEEDSLVFWIKPGVVVNISNLTIKNGKATNDTFDRNGGGIYNEGTLTINNCILTDDCAKDASGADGLDDASAAGNGGAIYNKGTLTVTNCNFTDNHAGKGGDASATHKSSAGGNGGAIYNIGTILNIQNCTFSNNYAGNGGKSSAFHDGKKGGDGGAIYTTGTINNIQGCDFTGNHAGNGGSVQASTAANGGAGGSGGAIFSNKNITVNNSTFNGNYAGNGGDGSDLNRGADGGNGGTIYNTGTFTITDSEIQNTFAGDGGDGYGFYNGGDGGYGGAIWNDGTFTITNCEISGSKAGQGGTGHSYPELNTYDGDNGMGGGIYNNATLTIRNSEIHDNTAESGGGIYNKGSTSLTNTSLTNNNAQYRIRYYNGASTHPLVLYLYGGEGGAVWNNGVLTSDNNTFTNNTAMYGGALYYTGDGTYNVTNCSFENNTVEAVDDNGDPLEVVTYSFTGSGLDFISAVVKTVAGVVDLSSANPVNGVMKIVESVNSVVKMIKTDTNTVEAAGAAIYMLNSVNLSMNNCNFTNNSASLGGGVANFGTGTLNITSCTFTNNPAGMGGAVYCNDLGPLNVTNSIFDGNCANTGAAISYTGSQSSQWGTLTVTQNIFRNNDGSLGGAVYDNFQGNTHIYMNFNRIYGTENYDIYNDVGKADAQFNWWDSNYGPGVYETSDCNIVAEPYMILTINSPNVHFGESSTITFDMLHDNTGVYQDPAYGMVPDGIPINLTVTSGTITPSTVTLINGRASATYTANGNTGSVTVSTIVDDNVHYPITSTFSVNKIPTNIYMNPLHGSAGSNITITALVKDVNGNLINDGEVSYQIGTEIDPFIAPVINGSATYNWTIPSTAKPGDQYTIIATYNGTSKYTSSETQTTLTVDITPLLLSASTRVKQFTETNNRLPNYVTIQNQKLTMPQFLDLLTKLTLQIDKGSLESINIKSVNPAPKPHGINSAGNIYKSEYLNIAQNIQNFINEFGRAPNFANTSLGTVQFTKLVYMYSKIICFYKEHNRLPKYVMTN